MADEVVRFECPSCGAKLNAPSKLSGQINKCPKCAGPVCVPEPVTDFFDDLFGEDGATQSDATPAKSSRLTTCPDCTHQVSRRAVTCPSCGCPLQGAQTEARLTIYRTYQHEGSLQSAELKLDGSSIGQLDPGDDISMVVSPGRHSLYVEVGIFGRRGERVSFTVDTGEHVFVEFNPFAGILGEQDGV